MNNSDFVDLHVHTSYSLLDGTASPTKIVQATKQLGRKYLAITDHGVLDGWVEHAKQCDKNKISPIFGIELYMLEDWENRHVGKPKNLHLTAIAKTEEGQKKLIQACGYAYSEGIAKTGFSKRAFLPMDYPLKNGWAGHVIIATGCASSPFWNAKNGIDLLASYYDAFKSDLYAELMPITDWEVQKTINANALEAVKTFGIKPIATCDVHYLAKEDSEFHEVMLGIGSGSGTTINSKNRFRFDSHCSHIHSTEAIYEAFRKLNVGEETIHALVLNTVEIAEKTHHSLKPTGVILPNVLGSKDDQDESERFEQLVVQGFESLQVPTTDVYFDRLQREIQVIREKKFIRYFLMVWDVIKWAKANGVYVGPARGSVGGSLVAYCLGITNLDPLQYGLFFERFIALDRYDYPDIDIDIDSRNRHLVEHYLKQKYGSDNVAHVSTFGRLMGRSAIRDVSRFLEVPLVEADKMSKSIIHKYDAEEGADETIKLTLASNDPVAIAFQQKYPKVVQYAQQLEGLTKSYGVHASGYVISEQTLQNSDRCYLVNRNDQWTINWNGEDLEFMGFIKLDLLGLSTLSAISECLNLVKKNHNLDIDMTKIPMDDPLTFEMVSKGETPTVFQLSTPGTLKFCKELKPSNFRHMAAIPALWKPGPITAGMTEGYKKCKLGEQKPFYYSDEYKKITEETYGFIIYQEQVVLLLTNLAGFSWLEADKVRKIISKQLGIEKLAAYEDQFVNGCLKKKSLEEDVARSLWQSLAMFGAYVLNKSHAVGYSMLAYWCAYLKAHYPAEWICAYLNYGSADKEDKKTGEKNIDVALNEAKRLGIQIKTPDINKSDVYWSVDGNALRVGLKDIVFVGDGAQAEIAKMKANGPIKSFEEFLARRENESAINKRVVKSLLYCGAFEETEPTSQFPMTPNQFYLRAMNEFEIFWEMRKKSKEKFEEYLNGPPGILCGPEFYAEQRKELLKFNSESVDDGYSLRKIAEITGMTVDKNDEDEFHLIAPDGTVFSRHEAETCQLPNTGLKLVHAVNGNFKPLANENKECNKCDLRKTCKAPVPIRMGTLDIMLIGETPNWEDEKVGKPFSGTNANKVWEVFEEFGIEKSMLNSINVVQCAPRKGYKITTDDMDNCEWAPRYIKAMKPKFIASFGNAPMYMFSGREKGVTSYNGKTEWCPKFNAWITYIINPSMLYYHPEDISLLRAGIGEFVRCLLQFV